MRSLLHTHQLFSHLMMLEFSVNNYQQVNNDSFVHSFINWMNKDWFIKRKVTIRHCSLLLPPLGNMQQWDNFTCWQWFIKLMEVCDIYQRLSGIFGRYQNFERQEAVLCLKELLLFACSRWNVLSLQTRRRCHWQLSAAMWWLRWMGKRSEVASIHGVWQKVSSFSHHERGTTLHFVCTFMMN